MTRTPTEMKRIPAGCIVTGARCGPDATILLTDGPLLLACGDNRSNRLGLNPSSIFFRTKVELHFRFLCIFHASKLLQRINSS